MVVGFQLSIMPLDTDKKQTELVVTLFNDLIVVSNTTTKRGTLKLQDTIKLSEIEFKVLHLPTGEVNQFRNQRHANGQ